MTTCSKPPAVSPRLVFIVLPLLLLLISAPGILCTVSYDHVDVGFSTSAIRSVDVNGYFLHSVDDTFALGFSTFGGPQGEYYLSIVHLSTFVVVWTANRNSPVRQSDLLYFEPDGNVTLKNTQGVAVWSSDTKGGSWMQLQETGNLVVLDQRNRTLWQSFDHPTDTVLTGQKLVPGMRLTANKDTSDFSEGSYYMAMQDNDLQLWFDVQDSNPQAYWSMTRDGKTDRLNPSASVAYALIDGFTRSLVLCSEDGTIVSSLLLDAYSIPTLRRATLGPDGNLQVYYYSGSLWNLALLAVRDRCNLPESCGAYGLCSNNGQCVCPPKTDPVDSSDFSRGCIPRLSATRCSAAHNGTNSSNSSSNSSASSVAFLPIGSVDYYANAFSKPRAKISDLDSCFQACMDDCVCSALFFHNNTGSCFVWQGLGTVRADSDANHLGFLKVNRSEIPSGPSGGRGAGSVKSKAPVAVISLIAGGTAVVIGGLLVGAWCLHRRRVAKAARLAALAAEDDELMEIPGLPTRFTYKELEIATNGFANKLGSGGFGSVYEGTLPDNTKIAVKRLESVGQGKKEFWAEVATIGSIHHVHLVRLVGFCAEGPSRLLVYEFMSNGSLDKILFRKEDEKPESAVLDWETRVSICLGTAQGMAYLHEDCRERIIHCDIKPENILLDERFSAKVSDFGLAKLMNREQSEVFTTMRGTRGYLAPEWLMNYAISDKSDVYSFGMVLLELVSGRKNFDPTESSEKWYFPIYAYRIVEVGKLNLLADPRLNGLVDEDQVRLLTRVALWCIQDEVAIRPSMKTVVKMLEGIVEVPNPPSSPQMAVRLHGRKYDTSGNDSKDSLFNSGDMSATHLSAPR